MERDRDPLQREPESSFPLSQISPLIQKAAVATEDARFYEHHGVDMKGSARALLQTHGPVTLRQGKLHDHNAVRP